MEPNKTNIVQIRWDKGIQDTANIGGDVTGIDYGQDMESDLLFFTNNPSGSELQSINLTDKSITPVIDLAANNVEGNGVATNPQIFQLVNVTVKDNSDSDLVGPRGLTFSPDNKTFYVSSYSTSDIKVFNHTTFNFNNSISPPDLVNPTDLVFGPNGTLFISSFSSNQILEYNITSGETLEFVGGRDGIFGPVGLEVSPDLRHLFVSNSLDNTIKKINLFTIPEKVQIINETQNVNFTTFLINPNEAKGHVIDFVNASNGKSLQNPQYLAFDPDGNLYVSSFDTDKILSWFSNGTFKGEFGTTLEGQEKLQGPTGITFSQDGQFIFVASTKTNQVLKFDFDSGQFIGVFSDEQTISPDGLLIAPNGTLMVSSIGSNEVLEYGNPEARFYVSDWTSDDHRIISFNATGHETRSVHVNWLNMTDPQNIASDSEGRLWIADAGTERLIKFNVVANDTAGPDIITSSIVEVLAPELTRINGTNSTFWVDNFGNNHTSFIENVTTSVNPMGISTDQMDNLYVTDWDENRIVVLNSIGNFLGQIRLNSTFTLPLDIAINKTNENPLDAIAVYDTNFEDNGGKLITLDGEKQFQVLEFNEELSPFMRGLTTNGTSLVTTPSDSGSLLEIKPSKEAHFDSKHFIVPLGIDIADNSIFVSDWKEQRIVQLDMGLNFTDEFELTDSFRTNDQGDIEVDTSAQFFRVTEPRAATIDKIRFDGTTTKFQSVADKYVAFSAIDSDRQDNFYVISNANETIAKFDIRGTPLAEANFTLSDTDIMVDIALGTIPPDSPESVFLATSNDINKLWEFDSTDLKLLNNKTITVRPTSIAVDTFGDIYVSQSDLKVTKFNAAFDPIDEFTIIPDVDGSIDDMVIDKKNNLYASDKNLDRIYKYDLELDKFVGWLGKCTLGSNTTKCDFDSGHSKGFVCNDAPLPEGCINSDNISHGRDVSQFFEPTSLAVDGLNNIYVADIKLSRNQVNETNPFVNMSDIFNRGSVPRVQKFTQNGFFVDQVVSDTNQTLVQGNFDWIKAIAYGTNNFYVADPEKLHVFDVNPFINITTNTATNQTTAEVTYQSFTELIGETDSDMFLYKVSDGFNESNTALVDITIVTSDPDGDGILGALDLFPNDNSTFEFRSSIDGTNGTISQVGDQELTIREAKDPEKGVYTQANILGGTDVAKIRYCADLAEVVLKPGNRLIATCTMGGENKTEPVGVELEIIRGKIGVTFFDREGRNSTSQILLENTIHFSPVPFEYISGEKNLDFINQTVHFNGLNHSYVVPPNSKVRIDTAPPLLPEDDCNTQLTLEAELLSGVDWTNSDTTNQLALIEEWLTFNATDVDNGDPKETDEEQIIVVNNATNSKFFNFTSGLVPTSNTVEFFVVDKIGNNSTCTNTVNVRDTTKPELRFAEGFIEHFVLEGGGVQIIGPTNDTSEFSEFGNAFFDVPKIHDLPFSLAGPKQEITNHTASCSPTSGSEFRIGNTTIICFANDLSGNDQSTWFDVIIKPHPTGLTIKNVTAFGSQPGLTNGDKIIVEFNMPTNQPPVSTRAELDAIFNLTDGNFSNGTSGKFIVPSRLLITINDASSADLEPGLTIFDLNFVDDPLFQSASGIINSSGVNEIANPVNLTGSFSSLPPPSITKFVVHDPKLDETFEDRHYSVGDQFTIRFSEPTNAPGLGEVLKKGEVDSLFNFSSYKLGNDYVGVWKNRSTFVITVTEIHDGSMAKIPTLGSTQAKVIGDIKNKAQTSPRSTSISPPLSGGFGQFYSILEIIKNNTFVQTLPSGLTLGLQAVNTTVFLELPEIEVTSVILASEIMDLSVTNSTEACEEGCEISFYIHKSDLEPLKLSLDAVRIFHDANDDTEIQNEEILTPQFTKLFGDLYKFSVTVDKLSFTGLTSPGTGTGGSSHDRTPPSLLSGSLGGDTSGGGIALEEIKFENTFEKSIIETGKPYSVKFTLYENSGPQALEHISLYTNLHGFKRDVPDSDAYVRYDKGLGATAYDPNGFFEDYDVFILENGSNLEIEFTLTFAKSMETSDLVVRAWDVRKNSADARFVNAIQIVDATRAEIIQLEEKTFAKWAGFSEEIITDSELLAKLGIEGEKIPPWYQKIVSKWVQEGKLSYTDVVNALLFFEKRGILN